MKADFNFTTEEQNKIIALQLHSSKDFFVLEDEENKTAYIFDGEEDDCRADYDALDSEEKDSYSFLEYCQENVAVIDSLDDDYLVLTDEEADELAKEMILDSVWAFKPNFLSSFTGIDEDVFIAIQNNGKCESNNNAILSMIDDEDGFCREAIQWDGRGHFMSPYDGSENEEDVNGITYYIYRQN